MILMMIMIQIKSFSVYEWYSGCYNTYMLYAFYEITHWSQTKLGKSWANFGSKYLKIYETFVWTYIYLF